MRGVGEGTFGEGTFGGDSLLVPTIPFDSVEFCKQLGVTTADTYITSVLATSFVTGVTAPTSVTSAVAPPTTAGVTVSGYETGVEC